MPDTPSPDAGGEAIDQGPEADDDVVIDLEPEADDVVIDPEPDDDDDVVIDPEPDDDDDVVIDPEPEAGGHPVLDRVLRAEDHATAALEALDDLEGDGEWEAIGELVHTILEEPGRELTAAERAELCFRGGAAAETTSDEDGAQELFQQALAADPGHQATLLSIANLHYRRGELEQAEKTYRTLLARHRDDLDPASRAGAYYRLARIRMDEVGDRDRARAVVEKALSSLPSHPAARRLLIDLHRADGNWEKVVAHERRLCDFEEDPSHRYAGLLKAGDTAAEHLPDSDAAERLYLDAAEASPTEAEPWQRLARLHRGRRDAPSAVRALARLAALPGAPLEDRAGWHVEMARLYRDALEDGEAAVACFGQALDFDPTLLDAFGECEELLVAEADWLALEQHHRRMLARLGRDGAAEVRAVLWRNLAELYSSRLDDPERALLAAEAVCDLAPGDRAAFALAEQLMEGRKDLDFDRVRRLHRRFLALEPRRLESVRALRRVELRAGRADAAWLLCDRLAESGDIQPDEEAYLENLRRPTLPPMARTLTDDLWHNHLLHPDAVCPVAHLLGLVGQAVLPLYAREPKRFGVKKRKTLIDPHGPLLFSRVLSDVSVALGLPEPPDAHKVRKHEGMSIAPASPPLLLVGADMLSGRSHRELAFVVARTVALFRADFLPTVYVPEETLPWLVRCIVGRYAPSLSVERDKAADSVERVLERELADDAELRTVALRIAEEGEVALDVSGYLRGIRRTCDRVGLLFSEDLAMSARQTQEAGHDDLLAFAIADDYLALREALGIAYRIDDEAG